MEYNSVISIFMKVWSSPIHGSPKFLWESKFLLVNLPLKEWEKDSYIPPSLEIISHFSNIEEIQNEMENMEITEAASLKREK
jgi:hypothetical protein